MSYAAAGVVLAAGLLFAGATFEGSRLLGMGLALTAGSASLALGLLAVTRFEWFVWAVLLVRPVLDLGAPTVPAGAMLAAFFLAISSVWLLVQRRSGEWHAPSVATKTALAFGAVCAIAVTTSRLPGVSARALLEILAGIAMFVVLEQLLRGRRDRVVRLIAAVMVGAIVPLVIGYAQWVAGDVVGSRTDIGRIKSTFVHPNPFATYLVFVTILTVTVVIVSRARVRLAASALLVALAGMIVLTYNRSGWFALVLALAYVGARRSRWILAALVAAVVALVALVPSVGDRLEDVRGGEDFAYVPDDVPENSLEWRFQYWESLVPMAESSPLTGIGPQVVVNVRPERLEPHSVFVQTYVEVGLLGLLALGAVVVTTGREFAARRRGATTAFERQLAIGATAAGIATLTMAISENLLTQTMAWWYFAACSTWGFVASARPDVESPSVDGDDRTVAGRAP